MIEKHRVLSDYWLGILAAGDEDHRGAGRAHYPHQMRAEAIHLDGLFRRVSDIGTWMSDSCGAIRSAVSSGAAVAASERLVGRLLAARLHALAKASVLWLEISYGRSHPHVSERYQASS